MNKSLLPLLAASLLALTAVAAPAPARPNLVGWWRAEGNTQDSAGRHDGVTPYGMNYARGQVGQAFDFDGSGRQRIHVPDSPDFKLTNAFTIEGWIYPRQFGGVIFFRGDDRPCLDPWQLDVGTAGCVGFQIMTAQNQTVRIEAPVRLNQWQHVAATFGARGNLFLYVNGERLAQTNTTLRPIGDLEPTQNPGLGIGNTQGTSYNAPFNGMIDEIALHSRALNPRQIRAIYRAGLAGASIAQTLSPSDGLTFREVRYDGRLADDEARFSLDVDVEAADKGESSAPLLAGDVAILPARLPDALRIVREGNAYRLVASRPGRFNFKLDVVAKIQREEPWNQVTFTGPAATIASVTARAGGTDTELQLLNGTVLENVRTNGLAQVKGFLGADQTVALRWQTRVTAVARQALLTVDSTTDTRITPAVIKYTSRFHYDVIQGSVAQFVLSLPAAQTLTRIEGDQIRDWHTTVEGSNQVLTVEFIKPVGQACDLTINSEQTMDRAVADTSLNPPQPLNVERESGLISIAAEDTLVEVGPLTGLRQVNAPDKALAAYRFNARPFRLPLKLKPIEPVVTVADRVSARLEETRLVVSHNLALDVGKAGIYSLALTPPAGFAVADVRGDGIEDWKVGDGKIQVSFSARVLGARRVEVQLEQALRNFPEQISLQPLRVAGAARETAQIGAAAAPGIRLRTATLAGLREIPVNSLPDPAGEILAYAAEQPGWQLTIATEKLAARVVADVFNLVTIGDGLVGGSATIRYSLANQGVQEFKVRVPAQFKNVEFTGPNIRRKEQAGDVWTIGLQDKAWGGYTLVVTYDYPFEPKGATLPVGGVHPLDVERETGSVAVTTAASLQLSPKTVSDVLHRVDETELSAADRPLITRAVVLAWQYTGDQYDLAVDVKRYAEEPVLEAVADRTQITSVLTASGEMLSQASFMVKNNEKQFQRFQLPPDARLWGCYVNNQPAKPERDGDWVLVSLPRDANRDQAFAVDIMYAETNGALGSFWGKSLALAAPRTDIPNTYAEWQLFVPPSFRLSAFGGSMKIAEGTTYELLDAWGKFLAFYGEVLREAGGAILVIGFLALLIIALVISSVRRGWSGVLTLLVVVGILAVLGAMLLPALSAAKRKAQRINSVSNLKQIGVAVQLFSGDNNHRLPASFDEMKEELGTDKITYDTETGQRYTYLGGGLSLDTLKPDSVLAYSPLVNGHCEVLYADGSVQQMTAEGFAQLSQRGLVQLATPQEMAAQRQREAVAASQMPATATPPPAAAPAQSATFRTFAGATGGGGGGGGSFEAGLAAVPEKAPAPGVAGIRSLRIELPQTGQPFLFTKVLNVRDEPLSIRARIMPLHTFQMLQMLWQTAAFLVGLGVWWWEWRRTDRNSLILTVALALIIGSVCSLLIQWRALHDALIIGFPVALVAAIAWLVWRYWPRGNAPKSSEPPPAAPPSPDAGLPPMLAAVVLLLALSLTGARAANSDLRTSNSGPDAAIVSASYSGTVNDRVAMLDATLQFAGARTGEVVPLFADDVAVQNFTVKRGNAELIRSADHIAVRFGRNGDATLQIQLLVKVTGDPATRDRLAFRIPPALSSRLTLTLGEAGADVDFPAAIAFKRVPDKSKTRVEAVLGSGDRVELSWTPRVKRAGEIAATVFCRNAALVAFGGGVVNVRATLDYQITQGELRQARVQLPAGQRLLRVEGAGIRTWTVRETNGAPVLVVDLLKGAMPSWRLTVETETGLDALPADVAVAVPQALDVKRETGLIALQGTEELGLSVESAAGLERVDAEEFARAAAGPAGNLASVFRFSQPAFALRVRAEVIQPEIEAVVRNAFRLGTDQAKLSATIDYTIKRAGVFVLRIALPEGYRLDRVTGGNIQQQTERNAAGSRGLEVTLKDRTSGSYSLSLELSRDYQELPQSFAVAGVHPLDAAKLTGYVAVTAEPGVAVKTESFDGLTEIPATALPVLPRPGDAETGGVLAYKFISTEPKAAPEWKLSVATETVAAWVRAEVVNTFLLTESLVNGRALVRYDIANAPVKELDIRVPDTFRNVEISGPNIRSRRQDGNVWHVELQSPTQGLYTLTVTWDQPRPGSTNALTLAGVSVENVERETGWLAIATRAPLQVDEINATDLQRMDTGDLPDWSGEPDRATALTYHYVRPGYRLNLAVRRFGEAEVLQALVDSAHFTSVVAEDGQMMTELSLSVRNNGRQFLEVELPPGTKETWSAFVAGQPVRPSLRDGRLLLPIQSSGADDGAMTVELTYVGTNSFPRGRGPVALASPKFDVPLKNARWELYLPPNYTYQDFQGTMTRETAAAPEAASAIFSSLEYSRMEQASKESAQVEMQRDVSEARRQLAGGNVREAGANLNRAKAKFYSWKGGEADAQQLEKDLQSAQASNLIMAQNDFSARNNSQVAGAANAPAQSGDMGLLYDRATAEQQWAKLQQAQEIAAAQVQPLHVNLPVRGAHFAFTQVLQTETGRPMTVQFWAANTKAVSWPKRGLQMALAFLALWALVAVVARVTQHARGRMETT